MNKYLLRIVPAVRKYASFIGPGIMVSVAYMDPGNYSTAVSAGTDYEYKLLVVCFLSNVFAVILQCLCVKLGTITGLDLAEMCRMVLLRWLNLFMYVCAEIAIVATDLAEVVGTAIALEILFGIPLVLGSFITILDVLLVLLAYHKNGNMRQTRMFENFVLVLVAATCMCFVIELFKCDFAPGALGDIARGFLPMSPDVFTESRALFLSCGIVGSTVMPHSLYLGSSIVQSRLRDYDTRNGILAIGRTPAHHAYPAVPDSESTSVDSHNAASIDSVPRSKFMSFSDATHLARKYKPSYAAIKHCLTWSYVELVLSLFLIAVFVNTSILIVAGSTLHGKPEAENADLYSIYNMLSRYLSPAAGFVFALSMLFSGQSAGIVCTMAGQIVSEGFINWSFTPWVRRIVTRGLAIVPVVAFISILGREGVATIMNFSQVVLSFILPICSAPLIFFTASKKYMAVYNAHAPADAPATETTTLLTRRASRELSSDFDCEVGAFGTRVISFENSLLLNVVSITTWLVITFLNIYLVYLYTKGIQL